MIGKCFHKRLIDNIAIVIFIAGLCLLFICANRCIKRVAGELITCAEGSIDAVFRRDWEDAVLLLEEGVTRFESEKNCLMLFLDHTSLTEIEGSLEGCLQLAKACDDAQILLELETIIARAEFLRRVEQLRLFTFL